MLRIRFVIGVCVFCLAAGACDDDEGDPAVLCGTLDETACEAASECHWMVAACPDEFIAAACMDVGYFPGPPPCAPQPCRTYADEAECAAQDACTWWPETCEGHTYTDRCRNVGHGTCP